MNKTVVVSLVLLVLLIISVAQAVQINDVKEKLGSGELVVQPQPVAAPQPAPQVAALPSQPGCGL